MHARVRQNPMSNRLQAYKDFHSKTTVVPTFAYPTTKNHSRTHRVIRPFNWFEELNALFSTTEDMTLPLSWTFSCYRTQHPTGVHILIHACARAPAAAVGRAAPGRGRGRGAPDGNSSARRWRRRSAPGGSCSAGIGQRRDGRTGAPWWS